MSIFALTSTLPLITWRLSRFFRYPQHAVDCLASEKNWFGSDSLLAQEREMKAKSARIGVPVQQKKKTRNDSNVSIGDPLYWVGRHMFLTSNQVAMTPT